jgi:hypothetical protein
MVTTTLHELVCIWEYWTAGDPLLRQALDAAEDNGDTLYDLLDGVTARLTLLPRYAMRGDPGGYATALASYAVLLALTSKDYERDAAWRSAARDARDAHQAALAGGQHIKDQALGLGQARAGFQ